MILFSELQQPFHVIIDNKDSIIDYLPHAIAVFAVGISLAAFVKSSRALRPFLALTGSNTHADKGLFNSRYSIKNGGLGPARVVSCIFRYKENEYTSFSELMIKEENDYFSKATDESNWMYDTTGIVLSPIEEQELFNCTLRIVYPDSLHFLRFLSEVELIVKYKSVHGRKGKFSKALNVAPTGFQPGINV